MSIAFVLSGGGSLGSVQVGMLRALAERGVAPDLIVGTSVGAVNGAFIAGRPGSEGAEALAEVWRSIRREDAFPSRPLIGALGLFGRRNHLVSPDPLRELVRRHVRFASLEEAPIPLHVVATDLMTGGEIVLARGDAADAVAASAAIPGVFPPVRIEDHDLIDGGVANNTPISHAVSQGASTVYVLASGFSCALGQPPRSALGMGLQALTVLIHQRLAIDVSLYEGACELRVVPPLCPLEVSPADFRHTDELIRRAYEQTREWLEAGPTAKGQAEMITPHHHYLSVSRRGSGGVL